ncbi:MAG: EAL domain-containing protein [Lachnospiraceae bacterium]|nr:EAL domain-containing protein [Lachnospiraceae bacterium]
MKKTMTEREFVSRFKKAVKNGHIYVFYQMQINHSTGRMIGAEALMRWTDPSFGIQLPSDFIPALEKHGLIFDADLYVFECVCRFQKKCIDGSLTPVPISVNMSRYDIANTNYAESIEAIRSKYDVPVQYLRIEITESSAIGGTELISAVLEQLHSYGYIVEMDDFGNGYSSLNILKDLDVDIIKLDMRFLRGDLGGRGATIISSLVQMTKWLNTPVIAEGVETMEQADYMKSIGCDYIQGYLYSMPIPEEEFLKQLEQREHEPLAPAMNLIRTMDAGRFWNPDSLETLIFSNFVGAAAIFTYEGGRAEILRINEKYIRELGMNLTEKEIVRSDPWECMDAENRGIYEETIKKAIASRDEESCETWRSFTSKCCGEDRICIRTNLRIIGKAGEQHLIYAMVQNITAEKNSFLALESNERRFEHAFEQANVYAWEYTVATKEMRPCFRCMRDLGLPPLVKNYPEPAIEAGIFPPDYADMYRDWHRQIEAGVSQLEAIIPLTVGRVPFHVRYTTEFDMNGHPLKAYGSATLVINSKEGNASL